MILKPNKRKNSSPKLRKKCSKDPTQIEDNPDSKKPFPIIAENSMEVVDINTPLFKNKIKSKRQSPKKSDFTDDTVEPSQNQIRPKARQKSIFNEPSSKRFIKRKGVLKQLTIKHQKK